MSDTEQETPAESLEASAFGATAAFFRSLHAYGPEIIETSRVTFSPLEGPLVSVKGDGLNGYAVESLIELAGDDLDMVIENDRLVFSFTSWPREEAFASMVNRADEARPGELRR